MNHREEKKIVIKRGIKETRMKRDGRKEGENTKMRGEKVMFRSVTMKVSEKKESRMIQLHYERCSITHISVVARCN